MLRFVRFVWGEAETGSTGDPPQNEGILLSLELRLLWWPVGHMNYTDLSQVEI